MGDLGVGLWIMLGITIVAIALVFGLVWLLGRHDAECLAKKHRGHSQFHPERTERRWICEEPERH